MRSELGKRALAIASSLAMLLSVEKPARAEPDLPIEIEIVADPKLSMDPGILTLRSLGRFAFQYERALPSPNVFASPRVDAIVATLGRTAEEIFVAVPLAQLETTTIHEAFGHGARGRELGLEPAYQFALPQPYRSIFSPDDKTESSATTHFVNGSKPQVDRDIATTLAGIEANLRTSVVIEREMVRHEGLVDHADSLAYVSKLVYATSIYSPKLGTPGALGGSDDVQAYVTLLQDRFNRTSSADRTSIAHRLQTAYVWNFLDPMILFSGYAALRRVATGDRTFRAPLPEFHGLTFLATPRFGLTPFGAEQYVDLMIARSGALVDVYGRVGTSTLATYDGGGFHASGIPLCRCGRFRGGLEVDAWSQPATLLDARNEYARPQKLGGSFAGLLTAKIAGGFGLTGKLAWKSSGYLQGQPLDEGVYGFLGVTWREAAP